MKLTNRRSKPAVPSTLKRGKSSSQNKNRTSKRMSKLVLRSVCDVQPIPSSFEQESVLANTSNALAIPVISNASLFKPTSRRQSAVAAVLNLRKRLTMKRSSTAMSETVDSVLAGYTEAGIDASLRHAQCLLLSRLRLQCSRVPISTLFEETQADSSRSSMLSTSTSSINTPSGPLKCSMTDVTISNIRLTLMWTEKQHFVYAQRRRTTLLNAPTLKNRKFALLCVAISSGDVAIAPEVTSCNTDSSSASRAGVLCSQLNSQPMMHLHQGEEQTDAHLFGVSSMLVDDGREQPASRQIVCSEIVRDVDWAATDVVFRSPLKLTFRRSAQSSVRGVTRSQSKVSVSGAGTNKNKRCSRSSFRLNDTVSTSNQTQNGSHMEQSAKPSNKTESVRLEFYATLHDEDSIDEETEPDEIADMSLKCKRPLGHQSAEPVHRRPNFRLIAAATLPLADLERHFESGQVVKAKATGRGYGNADFDCNTTVAHPLERLPIALEPNFDANRNTAKRTRLSLSLKAAMRRLSEGVQSASTSSTSILSASGANDTDELPFHIPLFGAFTFALRVNTFDLQASFV